MNLAVSGSQNINIKNVSFAKEPEKQEEKQNKDTLLKNTPVTDLRIAYDKLSSSITEYPARGLTGNKHADFYEFLTMGIVPYIIGSGTLMAVFNSANKHFDAFSKGKANMLGGKMALGVLFYGIAKEMSKPLITTPVWLMTGIDPNKPYSKETYLPPESKYDSDIHSIEHHKVFESVEFPRWDLLYGKTEKGENRNAYYDKIAKKLGLGENLNDSDQEVKPRIKKIITKTITVKNLVPYLWAALGVGLAFQKPWENFLKVYTFKFWKIDAFKKTVKSFGRNFRDSLKELWSGGEAPSALKKYSGKALIGAAIIGTILGDWTILHGAKQKAHKKDIIDKNRKYTVD